MGLFWWWRGFTGDPRSVCFSETFEWSLRSEPFLIHGPLCFPGGISADFRTQLSEILHYEPRLQQEKRWKTLNNQTSLSTLYTNKDFRMYKTDCISLASGPGVFALGHWGTALWCWPPAGLFRLDERVEDWICWGKVMSVGLKVVVWWWNLQFTYGQCDS